jgi:hypothetical protein
MKPTAILALVLLCSACGSPDASPDTSTADRSAPAVAPAPAAAQGRYAPRDECSKLPGATDFHERLVEAVQLRNTDALVALADPAIKLDFGGGGGIAELRHRLNTGHPDHDLWTSLAQLLQLGCAKGQQGGIVMPWLFAQELGDVDPTAAMLVTGEDVPILPEPRASAKALGMISWDLVNVNGLYPERPFQRISMPGKQDGYIATGKLRSVLDYRLLASQEGGQWRITALVAGD